MKFQEVSFKSIGEFLDFLPEDELKITECLRSLVLDCIPGCTEKLSYNVPYFKLNKNICFIWPASVLWGKSKTYEGVRFGFVNGNLLHDELDYLEKGNRKQVFWKDFIAIKQEDIELLKAFIFEAVEIDKQFKKK